MHTMKNRRPMPSWCPPVARIVPAAMLLGVAGVAGLAPALRADIDPVTGIDFVTIGAPGNAPWAGDGTPGDSAIGRGRVDYEYRIGKFEVTTSQWAEFYNAAWDRPASDRIPHVSAPGFWGGTPMTPNTPGGRRWRVPTGNEMMPVGNISWRMAAIYCNYLHNGKATNREAFLTGAYDVSTFGVLADGATFTDQLTRSPGARCFIPTWDEWVKSAHFDPNKPNSSGGLGDWWVYSNGTDTPLLGAPPGVVVNGVTAQANFGWDEFEYPGLSPFTVPLGAYANTRSPWGLFDVAGGTREWNETSYGLQGPILRGADGSFWDSSQGFAASDSIYTLGSESPWIPTYEFGFRVAAAVPAPSITICLGASGLYLGTRRRREGGSSCDGRISSDSERSASLPARSRASSEPCNTG